MKILYSSIIFLISILTAFAQTTITVDPTANQHKISPWIYGRNNNLSDDPTQPVDAAQWKLYNDAGLRMYRENGGNNSTKYNWRLKLSSHPDWYNNVYAHNWNFSASSLLANTTNAQGLFAFQLLGKAASSTAHNFNDWQYTQDNGYINADKNWAGGGGPTAYGGNGGTGNPNLYLENWTADSTAAILDYWFKTLQYDQSRFMYWNMDNEPEVWQGTHDDVASAAITAEDYMQKYFAVAKAARAKFPSIKLVGPVSTNEWQWYNWNNKRVIDPKTGTSYVWMEYFIKRIAEEEAATGIRLLDVLDVHFYPSTENDAATTLQLHRLWFDTQYSYPHANGVKSTATNSYHWDDNITQEYFFGRCNQWLTQYIGANHNVTFSLSEYGTIANHGSEDANVVACWYASHLGVFAENNVELFTPWDWYNGQWEVMHLFSKHFGQVSVKTTSSDNNTVSGYSSLTAGGDSLIIVVVNRDQMDTHPVVLNIQNFSPSMASVSGYRLAGLGNTETFVSETTNALQSQAFTITNNTINFTAPVLSVTMIQIPTNQPVSVDVATAVKPAVAAEIVNIYPNPAKNMLQVDVADVGLYQLVLQNMLGQTIQTISCYGDTQVDMSAYSSGQYILQIIQSDVITVKKFIKE